MRFNNFLIMLLITIFIGCSSKNSTEKNIAQDTDFYMVRFSDNVFGIHLISDKYEKNSKKAIKATMLQSAKITLQNGYRYFVIIDNKKDKKTAKAEFSSIVFGGNTYFISKPSSTNTIICFKESPELIGKIYDSKKILK